jgi:hypothetical protein
MTGIWVPAPITPTEGGSWVAGLVFALGFIVFMGAVNLTGWLRNSSPRQKYVGPPEETPASHILPKAA